MDKETLSNYGWIVICTLVLAVMIALATPFGEYIKAGVESTVNGLYDVNNKAMDIVCKENVVSKENETFIPGATFTDGTFLSWEELKSLYPINDTTVSEDAFYNCDTLKTIVIPEGITTLGLQAFANCPSLTTVVLPKTLTTTADDVFINSASITNVHISDLSAFCNIFFDNAFGNPAYYAKKLYLNGELITELIVPNDVKLIGDHSFQKSSALTSVKIQSGTTTIGWSAFNGCTNLKTITIPASVTTFRNYALSDCSSLKTIHFEGTITQWNAILKNSDWNTNLNSVQVICSDGVINI